MFGGRRYNTRCRPEYCIPVCLHTCSYHTGQSADWLLGMGETACVENWEIVSVLVSVFVGLAQELDRAWAAGIAVGTAVGTDTGLGVVAVEVATGFGFEVQATDTASGIAADAADAVDAVDAVDAPHDVTRMVAALQKYGPAQIGIDASCVEGYTGGIITNCTSRNVDHAVAIIGADTDPLTGIDFWIVRNSWNTTFGEDGYFRVQRDTQQMGIFGGYFACYDKACKIAP